MIIVDKGQKGQGFYVFHDGLPHPVRRPAQTRDAAVIIRVISDVFFGIGTGGRGIAISIQIGDITQGIRRGTGQIRLRSANRSLSSSSYAVRGTTGYATRL